MDKFYKQNYQMFIAGKIRTFKEVNLVPSKFNPNNPVLTHVEFKRISFILAYELCFQTIDLTLDEIEFLRNTLKTPSEEIKQIINAKPYGTARGKNPQIQDFFRKYLPELI